MGRRGRSGHAKCNYCRLWVKPYHGPLGGEVATPDNMVACRHELQNRYGITEAQAKAFLKARFRDFEYPPYRRLAEYKRRVANGTLAPSHLPRRPASLLDYGVTADKLRGRDNDG